MPIQTLVREYESLDWEEGGGGAMPVDAVNGHQGMLSRFSSLLVFHKQVPQTNQNIQPMPVDGVNRLPRDPARHPD